MASPGWYADAIMMSRTQVYLPAEEHRQARKRASELGISLTEYVRRLVHADLAGPEPVRDPAVLFDLGDSGGSDVAADKDAYLAAAVAGREGRRR